MPTWQDIFMEDTRLCLRWHQCRPVLQEWVCFHTITIALLALFFDLRVSDWLASPMKDQKQVIKCS